MSAPSVKFVGGALCLDFANTLSGRDEETLHERLRCFADLVAWGGLAGLWSAEEGAGLRAIPAERARAAFAEALDLREAVHDLAIAGAGARRESLDRLNAVLAEAMEHRRIAPGDRGLAWRWDWPAGEPRRIAWAVALSAAELLCGPEAGRVKRCPGNACGWLFADRTKNGRRRWCEMSVCGNRAKGRRHHRRHRGEAD